MRPLAHDGDAIGEDERLFLVVRDEKRSEAEPPLQALDLELHLLAQLAVERAEGLVEEEQCRIEDDRARERDALLLAAGRARAEAELQACPDRRAAGWSRHARESTVGTRCASRAGKRRSVPP